MYSAPFDYYRPRTVAAALALLRKHKDSRVIAGGHSLLPAMKLRLTSPRALVDIGAIPGLSGIKSRGKTLEIGARTTHAEVASSALLQSSCPILAEAAAQIGDLQVRNRGTIGGSLAHADPAADLPTVMIALEATLVARSARGDRRIAAADFFVDLFTTALKPGELLTAIRVPASGKGTGGAYLKHPHPASAYAVVGVAALLDLQEGRIRRARLAVGGVTVNPVRAEQAEATLVGSRPDAETIAAAAKKVAASLVDPQGDHYASAAFRVHLASVLAARALATAAEKAKG